MEKFKYKKYKNEPHPYTNSGHEFLFEIRDGHACRCGNKKETYEEDGYQKELSLSCTALPCDICGLTNFNNGYVHTSRAPAAPKQKTKPKTTNGKKKEEKTISGLFRFEQLPKEIQEKLQGNSPFAKGQNEAARYDINGNYLGDVFYSGDGRAYLHPKDGSPSVLVKDEKGVDFSKMSQEEYTAYMRKRLKEMRDQNS